jgi:hypothetical protein
MSKWVASAAMIGAAFGGTTLVSASVPNGDGTVTACVSRGGAVRIIDAVVTACKTDPASQAEQTVLLSGPVELPPPTPQVAVVNGAPSDAVVVGPQGGVRVSSRCPEGAVAVGRVWLNGGVDRILVDGGRGPIYEIVGLGDPGLDLREGLLRAICLTNVIDGTD